MPEHEPTPQQWRDILASLQQDREQGQEQDREQEEGRGRDEGEPRRGKRRAGRDPERRRTRDWVRQERRRDPLRPAGALLVVALVLGLGLGARLLWPHDSGDSAAPEASAAAADGAAPAPDGTSPAPSPVTEESTAADLSDPDEVAGEAMRRYFTRNPPEDQDHRASVRRARPYLTAGLAANLSSAPDKNWNTLVSRGGRAKVTEVRTGPAGTDLPADNPVRVWRTATVEVDVRGYEHYRETKTVRVELTRNGDDWRASRLLGL